VLSRALYVAQHSSWPLQKLRELDKKFYKIQRELTSNLKSYPAALLNATRDGQAGHGFDIFSTQTNVRKRAMFHRNVHRSGSQSDCAHSIIHRSYRLNSRPVHKYQDNPILNWSSFSKSMKKRSLWFNSVLEEAAESGRSLASPLNFLDPPSSKPLMTDLIAGNCTEEQREWWASHGTTSIADLRSFNRQSLLWEWADFTSTGQDAFDSQQLEEFLGAVPQDDTNLRVGQFWLSNGVTLNQSHSGTEGKIFEIMGIQEQPDDSDPLIATRVWSLTSVPLTGDWARVGLDIFCSRRAENCFNTPSLKLYPINDLFGDKSFAITSGPTQIINPSRTLKKTIKLIRPSLTPIIPKPYTKNGQQWLGRESISPIRTIINNPYGFDIFTDGHWKLNNSGILEALQVLRPWESHTAAASIVIISRAPTWQTDGIVTIRLECGEKLQAKGAYHMELLGIAAALNLQEGLKAYTTIWSDCKSAVKIVNNLPSNISRRGKDPNLPLLETCLTAIKAAPSPDNLLIWCKAHPENRPVETWSREDWGNHIADRVANGEPPPECVTVNHHIRLDSSLIAMKLMTGYYWSDSVGRVLLSDPMEEAKIVRFNKAMLERDADRIEQGEDPIYSNSPTFITAKMWNAKALSIQQWASRCRIIYDKGMHGRNLGKTARTEAQKQVLGLCPICKAVDSQQHWLCQCDYLGANRIRTATRTEAETALTNMIREEAAKSPWKCKVKREDLVQQAGQCFLDVMQEHHQGYLLHVGRFTSTLLTRLRQMLGDLKPNRMYKWQWAPRHQLFQRTIVKLGRIFTKGAMRLWRQRASTAVQIYGQLEHLQPIILATIPTMPHAADRIKIAKFKEIQKLQDEEEGLTPELLGLPSKPTVPEDESTEPTLLSAGDISFLATRLSGIRRTRQRRSLRGYRYYALPPVTPTPISTTRTTTPSANGTAIERIILRVIKQKRRINLNLLPQELAILPPTNTIDTSSTNYTIITPTSLQSARRVGGARISSLPSRKRKRVMVPQLPLKKQSTTFSFTQRSIIPGRADLRGTKRKSNPSSKPTKHTGAKLRRTGENSDTTGTIPTSSDICVSDNQSTVSSGCTLSPLSVEELMDKGALSNVFYFSPSHDCVLDDVTCSVLSDHVSVNVCVNAISLELASVVD
jgi:hypothetical protein